MFEAKEASSRSVNVNVSHFMVQLMQVGSKTSCKPPVTSDQPLNEAPTSREAPVKHKV